MTERKRMKMVSLKINAETDREKMVLALANAGYRVRVEEMPDSFGPSFRVVFECSCEEVADDRA